MILPKTAMRMKWLLVPSMVVAAMASATVAAQAAEPDLMAVQTEIYGNYNTFLARGIVRNIGGDSFALNRRAAVWLYYPQQDDWQLVFDEPLPIIPAGGEYWPYAFFHLKHLETPLVYLVIWGGADINPGNDWTMEWEYLGPLL